MKNIKNFGKATAIFLILAVALNMNVSADVCMCDSCASCTEKLNDVSCSYVKLTSNISEMNTCIDAVGFNDKVLDCQGFTINGGGWGIFPNGIVLSGRYGDTIKNCIITNFPNQAIVLENAFDISIINNSLFFNSGGIGLSGTSTNIQVINNKLCSNPYGDIFVWSSLKSSVVGQNNVCDKIGGYASWDDEGYVGCTYSCLSISVVKTPKLKDPPIAEDVCYPNVSHIVANITVESDDMNADILSNVSVCLNVTYNSNLVYFDMKFVDFRGTGNALIPFDFTGGIGVYEVITEVNCLRNIKEDNYFDNFEGGSFEVKDCSVSSQVSPPNIPKSTQIPLKVGWNLISLPLNPINNSLDEVLKSIEGKYSDVYTMKNGGWDYRVFAYSSWFGGLSSIEYGRGYWVRMTEEGNLTIFGNEVAETSISLHEGWNLVGSIDCSINDLKVDYQSITDIYTFENDGWVYQSLYYSSWFGTLNMLLKNQGYWIKSNKDEVLIC